MVTIDIPAAMAIGSAVAFRHRDLLRRTRFEYLALRALILNLFGFTPLAHLFLLYFPDWELQYFNTYHAPPVWFSALFVILLNVSCLCFFWLTRALILRGQESRAYSLLIGTLVSIPLYMIIFHQRVLFVGDYAAFISGQATFLPFHDTFMRLLAATGAYLGVWLYALLWRKPKCVA